MDALTTAPFAVLLLALLTLVALIGRGQQRGPGALSWWKPVARAFAGAVLFAVTALSWTVICERTGLVTFFWNRAPSVLLIRLGVADDVYAPARGRGFLLACAVAGSLFLNSWRKDSAALPHPMRLRQSLAGFLLLASVAGALWVPWMAVTNLPLDLWTAMGNRSISGYTGATFFYQVSPDLLRLRALRVEGIDLFAAVTLLLWLFQCLWDRAMKSRPGSVRARWD
jgi:hypothetical protein